MNKYNIFFKGDSVNVTCENQTLHGGVFYKGVYIEGIHTRESVLISEDYLKRYYPDILESLIADSYFVIDNPEIIQAIRGSFVPQMIQKMDNQKDS